MLYYRREPREAHTRWTVRTAGHPNAGRIDPRGEAAASSEREKEEGLAV